MQLSTSNSGITFPNAILDSGTSLILTTTPIANAIYGSIGIKQAADGMCEFFFFSAFRLFFFFFVLKRSV